MEHGEHHEGCGCPACAGGRMDLKKKLLFAMVFFIAMGLVNMAFAGLIHLKLHAHDLFRHG